MRATDLYSRRRVLGLAAAVAGASLVNRYILEDDVDTDEDGLSDELEQSDIFHEDMQELYGDQFEGLDVGRKDFLIDGRYIGDASVSAETKDYVEDLFRDNGIHAQWLDHPGQYGEDWFDQEYDYTVRETIGPVNSFYAEHVEDSLKDTAVQLIVLPGTGNEKRMIYNRISELRGEDGEASGASLGNRAVMGERDNPVVETYMALHEIGHTWICHDYDNPDNNGVMGVESPADFLDDDIDTVLDFMPWEWEKIHENMDNIQDETGLDIVFRPCIWQESAHGVYDSVKDRLQR